MHRRLVRPCLIVFSLLTLVGCMKFKLTGPVAMAGLEMRDKSSVETYHGSFWPIEWSPETIHCVRPCELSNPDHTHCATPCEVTDIEHLHCPPPCVGLHSVDVHTTALDTLSAVVTLGVWVPQTIEWWCWIKPRDDSGEKPWDGTEDDFAAGGATALVRSARAGAGSR